MQNSTKQQVPLFTYSKDADGNSIPGTAQRVMLNGKPAFKTINHVIPTWADRELRARELREK